jgi:hypothetical protein
MRSFALVLGLLIGCSQSEASNDVAPGADAMVDSGGSIADSAVAIDSAVDDSAPTEVSLDAGCAPGRGTWAWGGDIVDKSDARAAFFAFVATHPIRTVYVEAEALLGGSADPPSLVSFVAEAKAKCIDVQLLFGNASWLHPAEQADAVALANKAVAFAKKHSDAAPVGVHFDVEPHGLPEWHGDVWDANNEALVNDYVDLLEKLHAATGGSGLTLSVDIPFWWDGTSQITRSGKRRPAMEYVIDTVDVTTLMDYRDTEAGIVANAEDELAYASTVGKRVVVGVETLCGLTPTTVTFCEEGQSGLEKALAAARTKLETHSGFGDFAVHHYGSWSTLKP